jgi:hypothetical protein
VSPEYLVTELKLLHVSAAHVTDMCSGGYEHLEHRKPVASAEPTVRAARRATTMQRIARVTV